MKTSSESLMDLAGRVKRLEDSAAAVQEKCVLRNGPKLG